MNKKTQQTIHSLGKVFLSIGYAVFLGAATSQSLIAGDALDTYYRNILFNPGTALVQAESRGRVTIYDSLDSDVIDEAMDSQFDRIENMMFIGIRHILTDGTIEVEEDGCDS